MSGPIRRTRSSPRRQSLSVVNGDTHNLHRIEVESTSKTRTTRSSAKRVSCDTQPDSPDCSSSSLSSPPLSPARTHTSGPPPAKQIALARENKRKQALLDDPNIVPGSVTAISVQCQCCRANVHLDKRGSRTYYASNWKRHIDGCASKLKNASHSRGINFQLSEWSVNLPLPHDESSALLAPDTHFVHFYPPVSGGAIIDGKDCDALPPRLKRVASS